MKRDDSMTEREERRDAYHYFAQDGSSWIAREAVTGDLNDLVALDDIAKSVPWGRDAIASFIGCVPGVFILFPSNRVGLTLGGPVGFVIARWVGDECEIMSIGVHPQYRRLGLGRMLMETVRRTALVHGKMLWLEYCEGCRSSGKRPYMYSQYCELFRRNMRKNQATMTIPRTPGERVEVDWAGKTGSLKDPVTGDIIPVYIFVAAMSYSQYCYAEGFLNMDLESWIDAHIHLFEFLGGVPKTVVPDNLKTGVTKVFWVEPEIQKNYQEMAEHYNTFIMPARVKRPRDKSVAEGAVGKFANTLLGKVRNQTFFTVEEFNETLIHYLDSYNSHQFQKKLGSRATLFAEEIDLLTPLPKQRYELATWRTATVQPNYHVAVHKMFYSVPFQYISKKLQVKTTRSMVEIYDGDTRICSHLRLEGRSGQYRTRPEHMPDKHQKYLQWDEKRFMNWAAQYGPSTEAVIRALLASHAIPQHGFRGCLAILKLPGKHEGRWDDRHIRSSAPRRATMRRRRLSRRPHRPSTSRKKGLSVSR